MTTRQRIASIAAGILAVALAAGGFGIARLTAAVPTPPPVGPGARAIAAQELRSKAASAQVGLALLQWNGETEDEFGRMIENFTVRFTGTHSAFQVAVVLVRQDWAVLDVRPYN